MSARRRRYDSEEAPSRSIFQHEFKAFLVAWDLPIPEFEALWEGFEVDAFYEDHRLIIELDGYRDHSQPDRFEADRERDALAIELQVRHAADHLEAAETQARAARPPVRAILAARDPHARATQPSHPAGAAGTSASGSVSATSAGSSGGSAASR